MIDLKPAKNLSKYDSSTCLLTTHLKVLQAIQYKDKQSKVTIDIRLFEKIKCLKSIRHKVKN